MRWEKVFGCKADPRSYGVYVKKASPDRRRILAFDPGFEYSMMRWEPPPSQEMLAYAKEHGVVISGYRPQRRKRRTNASRKGPPGDKKGRTRP